jgi:ribonuclease D
MPVIDTEQHVVRLLPQIEAAAWTGMDTEADSLHAYPEKLCLIQLSLPGTDELIDPLAGVDLKPLLSLLRRKPIYLHGADYDLRLLYRAYQFVPESVFDTMWAARLLGYAEFSLRHLVAQHLGVMLEKGPQKLNWAVRPLPERMALYAVNDTRYLQPLGELLATRLREEGRDLWHREICTKVVRESTRLREIDPETLWRIKGSDRLDRAGMAVLRELWRWRESEAMAANKPPYFIFSHEHLVALSAAVAQGRPTRDLLPRHLSAARGARLKAAIQKALEIPSAEHPHHRRSFGVRLTADGQRRFDELKRVRDCRAAELKLDPTVIASKAELILLAQGRDGKEGGMMGWQLELLGLEGAGQGKSGASVGGDP